ncbi:MAG: purine phosphoribosyltransferase family protein [Methanomassiliicoccales archaeon]|nr:MAG: purine phosphoribosyltransferase family protein [Methanomassiliicoccales archaeon]
MMKLLASLESSPVIKRGDYDYFVHPVTDGIPRMPSEILEEIVEGFMRIGDLNCDVIVGPEAMGIPLAAALSLRTKIPYNVVRKRRYGLPGETVVQQSTGYSKGEMYVNGLSRGERVVLVDDVVSTGGTIAGIIRTFRSMGVEVVDVLVAIEKGAGRATVERELGIKIKTLVKIEVKDGRVRIIT